MVNLHRIEKGVQASTTIGDEQGNGNMAETIAIYLIGGIAFVLAARWIYQTAAGRKETGGCGCSGGSCPASQTKDLTGHSECIGLQQFQDKQIPEKRQDRG